MIYGASQWDTEAQLMETLEGKFTGNPKTQTGTGFHKMVEDPTGVKIERIGGQDWYIAEGVGFTRQHYNLAMNYRDKHPWMVHEVPIAKVYTIGNTKIVVSGRMDGGNGMKVHDLKTKYSTVDFEEYIDSYQWRFYEDILGTDVFQYDVFEVKGFPTDIPISGPLLLEDVTIIPHEPLVCYRYINLQQDCERLLSEFLEFIECRNLWHLLKDGEEYINDNFLTI